MSSKGRGTDQFYLANRSIGAGENALALSGDYLSAAAFLGSIAMYFSQGMDSLFYAVATLFGWPLLLVLFADKLRASEAFTVTGVLANRFESRRLTLLSGITSLLISLFYLLVQLMGAGILLKVLLNIEYTVALFVVTLLTLGLVLFGGMKATTKVQSIKAIILFLFAGIILILLLQQFNYSPAQLWHEIALLDEGMGFMPSPKIASGWEQASLVLGLLLGLLGLPHVLMRFFTVRDRRSATWSAAGATFLIALFFTLNLIIGFGAYLLFFGETLSGGSNMALLHLATLLGGETFKWLLAFVVLVTILAVIAGLVMAASASLSQDLIPLIWPKLKNNLIVARLSILFLFLIGGGLATLFEGVNLAFLFGIAFSWAASAHFPLLFCQFFISSFNERAAFYMLLFASISSTLFIITSRTVWVDVIGFSEPLHPFYTPTLFILPFTFFIAWILRTK